ncbi:hypothetical protein IDH44_21650 [Paenibacillus sp. IB182496]|uniref:HAMP domain-containing protein n=1 Tax=Paenibacillus sabuli TaxID=2772509 RepID=A0A927BWV3_9BACL|nr:hypothetical protein [Paenibacillus sabuli]MBD2847807.1 hypothetical protein [Paenibacillus sabuli]
MQLIPIYAGAQTGKTADFFTMVNYDSFDGYNQDESAIMLNVNSDWLVNNIKTVNALGGFGESSLFLVNAEGEIIHADNASASFSEQLSERVLSQRLNQEQPFGYFTSEIAGERQFITYIDTNVQDWIIVSAQPYQSVVQGIERWRTFTLLAMSGFLVLSVLLSFLVAHKLYQPVDRMISAIRSSRAEAKGQDVRMDPDELRYVSEVYDQTLQQLQRVRLEQESGRRLAENYYLRRLITDSASFSEEEAGHYSKMSGLSLQEAGAYRLLILKIDRCVEFSSRISQEQRNLYGFAVSNIAGELFAAPYLCEAVDMKDGHIVVLLSGAAGDIADESQLTHLSKQVQEIVAS